MIPNQLSHVFYADALSHIASLHLTALMLEYGRHLGEGKWEHSSTWAGRLTYWIYMPNLCGQMIWSYSPRSSFELDPTGCLHDICLEYSHQRVVILHSQMDITALHQDLRQA